MLQCRNGVEKGLESSFLRPMNLKLEGRSTGLPLPMSGLKCKSFWIFPPISDLSTCFIFHFSRPDDSNRRHYEAVRGRVDSGESTSFMRSLLGMCQLFVYIWVNDYSVANFISFLQECNLFVSMMRLNLVARSRPYVGWLGAWPWMAVTQCFIHAVFRIQLQGDR